MRDLDCTGSLRSLVPVLLVLMASGSASAAESVEQPPDCQCRAPDGERRDLGTVTCVTIGSRQVQVRCEMSTNTPYWRPLDSGPGCPLA